MMIDEIAKTAGAHEQAVRSRPAHRRRRSGRESSAIGDRRRRSGVRRGARRPSRRHRPLSRQQRPRRQHVRQGATRDGSSRSRLRHRRRAGHRSRRPHGTSRDHGARPPGRRRGRRAGACGRRGRSLRRSGSRCVACARCGRRLDRHALHRDARGPSRAGLQRRAHRSRRGRHGDHRGRTPARRVASCATSGRSTSRTIPRS